MVYPFPYNFSNIWGVKDIMITDYNSSWITYVIKSNSTNILIQFFKAYSSNTGLVKDRLSICHNCDYLIHFDLAGLGDGREEGRRWLPGISGKV